MSDNRFTIEESENQLIIFDNEVSDETYFHLGNDERDVKYVCGLLNEQQATISALKEENKELGKNFDDLVEWASEIAKRNVVLDEQIGEQQATIEQLQDLCGQSDGENAKLRIENKRLKEENEKLSVERQRLIYHMNKEPKR